MNETPRDTIESTSDRRIENNVMRHEYKVLSEEEKRQMQAIKDEGLKFWDMVHRLGHFESHVNGCARYVGSRELSLAQTKIEEAVMWAIKHLTR